MKTPNFPVVVLSLLGLFFSSGAAFARTPIFWEPQAAALSLTGQTPLFEPLQKYLEAAPIGVGARAAWALPGGTGANVKVVDIEVCYETEHEDLPALFYNGANPRDMCESTDHGTAVWGEIAADHDDKGVTGISYGVKYGVYGFIEGDQDDMSPAYITGINTAIQGAIDHLSAGDVMVIEQEMNGPNGDVAVEYWPEIFAKLKAATNKGIICVEAAGNGSSNLDDPAYQGAFDLTKQDSGCIVVGAAGWDYTRMYFSDYGSRIDAFGYGTDVVTTAYGDLFNASPTRAYTSQFNGTSSATPIVSGAIALVSSMAKAKGRTLTPKEIRAALRSTGTPQNAADAATGRIGTLPDVAALAKVLGI